MLASFKYSYWYMFPMILEQFNSRKTCLQSNIFFKISEESICTLFRLEINLGFDSSWIIGTNALHEFVGCVTLWYLVCFSVLLSSGSQISLMASSWSFCDMIQTEVPVEETQIEINKNLVYVFHNL